MATVTQVTCKPRILLDNGMDSEGNVRTVTVNLNGTVQNQTLAGAFATFILGYSEALEPCLNKEINQVQAVVTHGITE